MKRSVLEALQKNGLEFSEEQLEDVTGGRGMTRRERDSFGRAFRPFTQYQPVNWDKMLEFNEIIDQYLDYIKSLPEGSPEMLFEDAEFYKKLQQAPPLPMSRPRLF